MKYNRNLNNGAVDKLQKCLSTIYYIVISIPTEHTIGRKTIQEISKEEYKPGLQNERRKHFPTKSKIIFNNR